MVAQAVGPVAQILLSSIIPAILAFAGIVYAQRRTAKESREGHEREQFRWTREHRRECYLALIAECRRLDRWMSIYYRVGPPDSDAYPEPGLDWMKDAHEILATVEMFASEEVGKAAKKLIDATRHAEEEGATPGSGMRLDNALEAFRKAAQKDLGLSVTTLDKEKWPE